MPAPSVPLDDRGLLLGDGLFETLAADQGRLIQFDEHLARLTRGCAVLGLPAPDPVAARAAAQDAIAAAGLDGRRAAVRLTWTAGSGGRGLERPDPVVPRLLAAASPATIPAGPAVLVSVDIRRNEHSPLSGVKSLAYLDNVLARRAARDAGADEALMLNTAGEAACASAANIFWIAEGRLHTPALTCGVLAGVVRAAVIEAAAALGVVVVEARAGPEALQAAEAVFLTNSLIGVRAVSGLDGRAFGEHPLVARLAEALGQWERA
jgi:branched-subunit amino acid aminotransferase/4-amino-4-deoxychorismate lyase